MGGCLLLEEEGGVALEQRADVGVEHAIRRHGLFLHREDEWMNGAGPLSFQRRYLT